MFQQIIKFDEIDWETRSAGAPRSRSSAWSQSSSLHRSRTIKDCNSLSSFIQSRRKTFHIKRHHLGIIPPQAPGEQGQLAGLSRQQGLEGSGPETLLLVVHHGTQVCIDLEKYMITVKLLSSHPHISAVRFRSKSHPKNHSCSSRDSKSCQRASTRA